MSEANARKSPVAQGPGTFEIETGSIEEFLGLLKEREDDEAVEALTLPRRAVWVEQLHDRSHTGYSFPMVRRYVLAIFSYGEDVVSYRIDVSHGLEIPDAPGSEKPQEGQRYAYERLREEITDDLGALGLATRVPVLRGYLHHSSNPRHARG